MAQQAGQGNAPPLAQAERVPINETTVYRDKTEEEGKSDSFLNETAGTGFNEKDAVSQNAIMVAGGSRYDVETGRSGRTRPEPPASEQPESSESSTGEHAVQAYVSRKVLPIAPRLLTARSLVSTLESDEMLTSEQSEADEKDGLLTSEQSSGSSEQSDNSTLLTSEQPIETREQEARLEPPASEQPESSESSTGEHAEDWLKNILPLADSGWWEVRAEGKGYSVKFRWRVSGEQQTQTFPRVSSEQFKTLKEAELDDAKRIIADRIFGHIEDCTYQPAKSDKARLVATRLGVSIENDQAVGF